VIFKCYIHFNSRKHPALTRRRPLLITDKTQFLRLCRETPGLCDEHVSLADADLVFQQAKPQGYESIDFSHFLEALMLLSWKKYPETGERNEKQQVLHSQ
jgi:hypothetical protein